MTATRGPLHGLSGVRRRAVADKHLVLRLYSSPGGGRLFLHVAWSAALRAMEQGLLVASSASLRTIRVPQQQNKEVPWCSGSKGRHGRRCRSTSPHSSRSFLSLLPLSLVSLSLSLPLFLPPVVFFSVFRCLSVSILCPFLSCFFTFFIYCSWWPSGMRTCVL